MTEPQWLTLEIVTALHEESLALFGGQPGIRDEGLLESALAHPRQRHAYDPQASLSDLAAAYCAGIIRNHPFIDGNKRAGLLAAAVFLQINGMHFDPDEIDETRTIMALAAGEIDEAELADWIARNATRL